MTTTKLDYDKGFDDGYSWEIDCDYENKSDEYVEGWEDGGADRQVDEDDIEKERPQSVTQKARQNTRNLFV